MQPYPVRNRDRETSMHPETLRMIDTCIQQQLKDAIAIRRASRWRPWLGVALVYIAAFAVAGWFS